MHETWQSIPSYEGVYSASNLGRIRRDLTTSRARAGHIRPPSPGKDGYLIIQLHRDGRGRTIGVHQLVFAAFNGPIPSELVINHKNGDKTDNRPENLEAITIGENIRHAIRCLGIRRDGEHNPAAKLTEDRVVQIRESFTAGLTFAEVARLYGISKPTATSIVRGETWPKVGGPILTGPKQQRTVLSNEKVTEIRNRYPHEGPTALAREYGVARRTILNFVQGKSRLHSS